MGGELMFENVLPYAFSRNSEPMYVPASMVREQYPGEQAYVPVRAVPEPMQDFYGVGSRGREIVPAHVEPWGQQVYSVPTRGGGEFVPVMASPVGHAYRGMHPRVQASAPAGGAFRQPAVEVLPVRDGVSGVMPRRQSHVPVYVPGEHGAGMYQPRTGYEAGHPFPAALKPRYGGYEKDLDGFVPVAMEPRYRGPGRGAGYGDGMVPIVLDPGYGGLDGGVAEPLENVSHAWQRVFRQAMPIRPEMVYDSPVFQVGDNVKKVDADAAQDAAAPVRIIPVTGKIAEVSQTGKVDGTSGAKAEGKMEELLKKGFLAHPAPKAPATSGHKDGSGQKDGAGLLRKGFLVPSHSRKNSQESASPPADRVKEASHASEGRSEPTEPSKEGGPISVPFDTFLKAVMDALKVDTDRRKTAPESAVPKTGGHEVGSDVNGKQSTVNAEYPKTSKDINLVYLDSKSADGERSSVQLAGKSGTSEKRSVGEGNAACGGQPAIRDEKSCATPSTKNVDAGSEVKLVEIEEAGGRSIQSCVKARVMDEEVAAKMIQAAFRGYSLRSTAPLEKARAIAQVRSEVREMANHFANYDDVGKLVMDPKEKLKVSEKLMQLLLRLDSILGVHPVIRELRKAVARDVTGLQDMLEATPIEDLAVFRAGSQDAVVEPSYCADGGTGFVTTDVGVKLLVDEVQQSEVTLDSVVSIPPAKDAAVVDVSHAGKLDCGVEMGPVRGPRDVADIPVGKSPGFLDRGVNSDEKDETNFETSSSLVEVGGSDEFRQAGSGASVENVGVCDNRDLSDSGVDTSLLRDILETSNVVPGRSELISQRSEVVRQDDSGASVESGEICENGETADSGVDKGLFRESFETSDVLSRESEATSSWDQADVSERGEFAAGGVGCKHDAAVVDDDEEGNMTTEDNLAFVSHATEGCRMGEVRTTECLLEQLPVSEHCTDRKTSQVSNCTEEQPVQVDSDRMIGMVDQVEDMVELESVRDSRPGVEGAVELKEVPDSQTGVCLRTAEDVREVPGVGTISSPESEDGIVKQHAETMPAVCECPGDVAEVLAPNSEERMLMRQLILENRKLETLVKKLLGVSESQTASIVDRLEKLEAKVREPKLRDYKANISQKDNAIRKLAGGRRRK